MIRRPSGPRANALDLAVVALFVAVFSAAGAARAQEQEAEQPERLFLLGAGVYATSNPYASARKEVETGVLPLFVYQNRFLTADLSGLAITAYSSDHIELAARISPRFQFVDPKDTRDFAFLERDTAVDVGARLTGSFGPARLSLEYLADASGETEGQELNLDLTVSASPNERLSVEAVVGVSWKDEALATWLYGLKESEVGPAQAYQFGRSPGAPSGGVWVPSFGVQMRYQLSDRVYVIAAAETEFYSHEITDSPLMAKDFTTAGFVSLVRRF